MNSFIWNGISSQKMGLWVESLPPITRPPMRYQQVTIPGRAGALTIREDDLYEVTDGADTYDAYVRDVRVMPKPGADIHKIVQWLSPGIKSSVVFSHEPKRQQQAEILEQFDFDHAFASQREATVRFLCDPFKTAYPTENPVIVNLLQHQGSYSLTNTGDVICWPIVYFQGSGSVSFTIGGITMSFSELSNTYVCVDCENGFAFTGTVVVPNSRPANWIPSFTDIVPVRMYGDFPYIRAQNATSISWQGTVSYLAFVARWLYL